MGLRLVNDILKDRIALMLILHIGYIHSTHMNPCFKFHSDPYRTERVRGKSERVDNSRCRKTKVPTGDRVPEFARFGTSGGKIFISQ